MKKVVLGILFIILLLGFNECNADSMKYDCYGVDSFKGSGFHIILNNNGSVNSNFSGMSFNEWEKESNGNILIQPDTEGYYEITHESTVSKLLDVYGNNIAICVLSNEYTNNLSTKTHTAPIKISIENYYNQFTETYYPEVVITSISDFVIIKNIIINKGNCTYRKQKIVRDYKSSNGLSYKNIFPKKLKYGEQMKITISKKCNVLKIDVFTNHGDWSVEY